MADDPFSGLPFFGDFMKRMSDGGPVHWDTARQIALFTATGGETESNPEPTSRLALVELSRLATMAIEQESGLVVPPTEPEAVNRAVWTARTLDDWKPLFTDLATALGSPRSETPTDDPFAAMFANLTGMMAPMTMGMSIGSMVGLLARRALGQYDLPLPRPDGRAPMFVTANIDGFADEWSLVRDDVRMWVLINELATHTLYAVPHVAAAVNDLVRQHAGLFRPDPSSISDRLAGLESADPSDLMASFQSMFSDPEVLLGAVRSPDQEALQPRLDALLALVVGWVDHVADRVGARILGNPQRLAEAARRRRIEAGDDTAFVEKLLGLRLNRDQVDRGRSFVRGVIERAGDGGLAPLYASAVNLPTPAELDAPGLWLARLDVTDE